MARTKTSGSFKKGDPRINRKGRPKSFDKLRLLAQQIAHEEAKGKDGSTVIINDHKVTVTEAILRQWASSKNPKLQQLFVEVAYGKVPNNHNIKIKNIHELSDDELRTIIAG